MTRFIARVLIIIIFVLSFTGNGYCDNALKKLGRGTANMLTCPLEIYDQMRKTNTESGPMAGISLGLLKGVGMTLVRAAVGVYEVVTFPAPIPKDYAPILTDPEFFFEDGLGMQ